MQYGWVDLLAGVAGLAVLAFCIRGWRNAESEAKRFRDVASVFYGDRAANRIYTAAGVRVGAFGGAAVGVLMMVLAVTGQFEN